MRNPILICIFSIFTIIKLQSQSTETTLPRQYILGGSFAFSSDKNGSPTDNIISSLTIFPSNFIESSSGGFRLSSYIGRQVSDNFIIGIFGGYAISRGTNTYNNLITNEIETSKSNGSDGSIGAFARFTLFPENSLNFFFQPNISYVGQKTSSTFENLNTENKYHYIRANIGLGMLYNITEKWRATLRLGNINYVTGSRAATQNNPKKSFSNINSNFSLASFQLGLEYRF